MAEVCSLRVLFFTTFVDPGIFMSIVFQSVLLCVLLMYVMYVCLTHIIKITYLLTYLLTYS